MDLMLLRQPGKITEVSQDTEDPAAKFDKREKKTPAKSPRFGAVSHLPNGASKYLKYCTQRSCDHVHHIRRGDRQTPHVQTDPFCVEGGVLHRLFEAAAGLTTRSSRGGAGIPSLLPTRLSSERRDDEIEDAVPRNNSNRRFRFDVPVWKPAQIPQILTKKEKMAA